MAISELNHLEQQIPVDGYKWVKGTSSTLDTQFLVPIDDSDFTSVRTYNPIENKALFRIFAATDPTPEGILKFANQFGLLKGEFSLFVEADSGKEFCYGDPIEIWKEEIEAMWPVITLWDAIQKKDIDALQGFFQWKDNHTLTTPNIILSFGAPQLTRDPKPSICIDSKLGQKSENAKLVAAALTYIEYELDKHLEASIKVALQDGKLQLIIKTEQLLHVLWLQCAQAICQHKSFRECRQCGTWFEPYSANTKKAYCSTACRLKNYRGRIAEAQQLRDQRKSIESIAGILNTDIETVKGWLTKGGSRK